MVILVWNHHLEEKTFRRLGLDYFYQDNVEVWDMQLHSVWRWFLGGDGRNKKKASSACEWLGIACEAVWGESLAHCAGNDAAFTIQMLLAVGTLTTEQLAQLNGQFSTDPAKKGIAPSPLSPLPQSWVDYTLARVNQPWLRRKTRAPAEPAPSVQARLSGGNIVSSETNMFIRRLQKTVPAPPAPSAPSAPPASNLTQVKPAGWVPPHLRQALPASDVAQVKPAGWIPPHLRQVEKPTPSPMAINVTPPDSGPSSAVDTRPRGGGPSSKDGECFSPPRMEATNAGDIVTWRLPPSRPEKVEWVPKQWRSEDWSETGGWWIRTPRDQLNDAMVHDHRLRSHWVSWSYEVEREQKSDVSDDSDDDDFGGGVHI